MINHRAVWINRRGSKGRFIMLIHRVVKGEVSVIPKLDGKISIEKRISPEAVLEQFLFQLMSFILVTVTFETVILELYRTLFLLPDLGQLQF